MTRISLTVCLLVAGAVYPTPTQAQPSATFVRSDTTSQGNWVGKYGSEGNVVVGDAVRMPAGLYFQVPATMLMWSRFSTEVRALEKLDGSTRVAGGFFAETTIPLVAIFTDGKAHDFAMYFLDWDRAGRA